MHNQMDDIETSDDDTLGYADTLYKNVRKRIHMEKVIKEFLGTSEYSAAREILHSMLGLCQEIDIRLEALLQIAECDVMIDRRIKQETDEKILALLHSSGKSATDMRELAQRSSETQSIVAFLYACKLFRQDPGGNIAVRNIEGCITRVAHDIEEMSKKTKLKAKPEKVYSLAVEMFSEMKQIRGADVDIQIVSEGSCAADIGCVLNNIGKKHQAYEILKEGRDYMTKHFGPSASGYQAYAALSNNISAALLLQGKFEEAVSYTEKSIAEIKNAKDISDSERRSWVQQFKRSLRKETDVLSRIKSGGIDCHVINMSCSAEHDGRSASASPVDIDDSDTKSASQNPQDDIEFLRKTTTREPTNFHSSMQIDAAVQEIQNSGSITKSTEGNILRDFERRGASWRDVRKMAEKHNGAGAVILHFYTCKLLPFAETPDKVLKEIRECFRRARNVIDEIIEGSGGESAKNLVSLLHKMIAELKGVRTGNDDLKVQTEANCLNKLGLIYTQLSKYDRALELFMEGRQIMQFHFGISTATHSTYAAIAKNIAYAYEKQHDYFKAAEYYEKAFTDVKEAKDLTGTAQSENLAAYRRGFESLVSHAESTDSQTAAKIRIHFGFRDIAQTTKQKRTNNVGTSDGGESQRSNKVKASGIYDQRLRVNTGTFPKDRAKEKSAKPKYPLVDVGNGICVDHTRPLRDCYQVYLGKLGGEDVAVKRIEYSEELCHEVEIMKNMDKHPNIVTYKAWSKWESKEIPGEKAIYLAMELCDKRTLYELAKDMSFTQDDRLLSLLQFTLGLCHIHKNEIIHGDLKPQNLLCSFDGGSVKVGDFGISKKLEWGRTHITATLAGTYGWMAPDDKLSKKFDIFSAGLIYYYILSGGEMLGQDKDFSRVTFADPVIARELICRMIDSDPSKRPTTAECSESPLFWNEKRKIRFICDMSDHLSNMPTDALLIERMNEESSDVFGESWADRLVPPQESVLQGKKAFKKSVDYDAIYEKAVDEYEKTNSISSLTHFIASCCHGVGVMGSKFEKLFRDEVEVWRYFNDRFPNIFSAVYKSAKRCGFFWSAEKKLEFLQRTDFTEIPVNRLFHDSWLEKLIMDKATVKALQEKVSISGEQYKISKYSVYNKAVTNDRKEEGEYDEKSVTSLLTFLMNRRKYFKEDGNLAKFVFGDDGEGILNFFIGRFPNLLDDLVLGYDLQTN